MNSLMESIIKIMLCSIVLFGALAQLAFSQNFDQNSSGYLPLRGAQSDEAFSQYMEYYLDPAGNLTIADILNEKQDSFAPLMTPTPHFGFTKDTIWLRVN